MYLLLEGFSSKKLDIKSSLCPCLASQFHDKETLYHLSHIAS